MRALVFLLCCLSSLALSAAEIYKWTDEKGRTHYSDRPPPADVKTERRELSAEPQRSEPETSAEDANAAEAARRCEAARTSLQQLRANTNVAMDLDGDGTPETLDAVQREEQILTLQRRVEQLCAPPSRPAASEAG